MPFSFIRPYLCSSCRLRLKYPASRQSSTGPSPPQSDSIAPRASYNTKHIRQNPDLYTKNCNLRNYQKQSTHPQRVKDLFQQWQALRDSSQSARKRSNDLQRLVSGKKRYIAGDGKSADGEETGREEAIKERRTIQEQIKDIEKQEEELQLEIEHLASQQPNLTSNVTPHGSQPRQLRTINVHPDPDYRKKPVSHVEIGAELGLLDFAAAATTSGWGWYYLREDAVMLEQALIQYALSVAAKRGWQLVSPPSIVYSHIASACGFQPRDQNDEQQVYTLRQRPEDARKPELSLAGTAEIPLAAMQANRTLSLEDLPLKMIGASRCYRAEAGARGLDTKGLYRVHEFTKVEMFAWTNPDAPVATETTTQPEAPPSSSTVFDEILSIQTEILTALDLHCRVLEMPSHDLGASATRKQDIEAYFPSRRAKDGGWGEVTSTSLCTDYQTRRLNTRVRLRDDGGTLAFPYTLNGTALAVPRVLAAILENGWDEERRVVRLPSVLRPWMGGRTEIG